MPRHFRHGRDTSALAAACAVALAAVIAMNLAGLPGSFLSDDFSHIYTIASMDRAGRLGSWLLARFTEALDSGNFAYRPIAFFSYALDWWLYGANATGWHVTNLALHVANVALVGALAHRWSGGSVAGASLAAALFAAYPFAGEVTFWPVGRFDLLATSLSLCFLLTLTGDRASALRHAARIAALILALLSKESAMPLPFVALLVDAGLHRAQTSRRGLAAMRDAVRFALADLAPVLAAFALYLLWRYLIFGTPVNVYQASRLPASIAEFGARLSYLWTMVEAQPGLTPAWLWPTVAALLLAACIAIALAAAPRTPERQPLVLPIAALAAACAYIVAPALSFPAASAGGMGARNYYVAWLYLSVGVGLLSAVARASSWLTVAAIAWMLVSAYGSLHAWHVAARYMRATTRAVPPFAASLPAGSFALLALPDHIGIAYFARDAEGGIVERPIQSRNYLPTLVGTTELGQWERHFQTDAIGRIRGEPGFDMTRFAGIHCFDPARGEFIPIGPGGPVRDFAAWAALVRATLARSACLPETLAEPN